MCQICSENPVERQGAKDAAFSHARQLRKLARYYEELGAGSLPPHGQQAESMAAIGKGCVRFLVEDWV